MEFTRLGEHKVRCLIAEQEILDMGYSMEEILKNGLETQRFMDQIFAMAERQLDIQFHEGIKTVRADFLSNHTLSLTFSTFSAEGMMGQLKNLLNHAISATADISPEELEELFHGEEPLPWEDEEPETNGETEVTKTMEHNEIRVGFAFDSWSTLMKVVKSMKKLKKEDIPHTELYKYQAIYYLLMDMSSLKKETALWIAMLTDEFADDFLTGPSQCACITEHGEPILVSNAIQQLQML